MLNKHHLLKIAISICILQCSIFSVAHAKATDAENSATVASELNALYNKTGGCNGNDPDYYCSGVIVHSASFTDVAEPWYLPDYRDVGSFSYLRNDIVSHIGSAIYKVIPFTGIILTPIDELRNAKQFSYEVDCSYPMNASSKGRQMHGCGDANNQLLGMDYSNCASKGVFSIDEYMKQFATETTYNYRGKLVTVTEFNSKECSFAPDKAGFKLSMDIAKYILRDNPKMGCEAYALTGEDEYCGMHNELIISAWPKNAVDASQVPIKAFFTVINSGASKEEDEAALSSAFKASADFSNATNQNRQIPVVIIDMKKIKDGSTDIFSPATKP